MRDDEQVRRLPRADRPAAAARGRSRRARRAAIVPGAQRLDQRRLVDDAAARGVDEDRGRAHQRERRGVDQVAGRWRQRQWRQTKSLRAQQLVELGCRRSSSTVMPKPSARRATARPMRPKPMIPSVAPCTSAPSQRAGSHVRQARRAHPPAPAAAAARRRAAARTRGRRSPRVSTSGVTPTGIPRARAGVKVDVVGADRVVGDRAQPRGGVEQLAHRPDRSAGTADPRRPRPRRAARPAGGGSSPSQTITSCSRLSRSSASPGRARVTKTLAISGFSPLRSPPCTRACRKPRSPGQPPAASDVANLIACSVRRGVEQSGSSSGS